MFLLDEHTTEAKVESRFPAFMKKYGKDIEKFGFNFL